MFWTSASTPRKCRVDISSRPKAKARCRETGWSCSARRLSYGLGQDVDYSYISILLIRTSQCSRARQTATSKTTASIRDARPLRVPGGPRAAVSTHTRIVALLPGPWPCGLCLCLALPCLATLAKLPFWPGLAPPDAAPPPLSTARITPTPTTPDLPYHAIGQSKRPPCWAEVDSRTSCRRGQCGRAGDADRSRNAASSGHRMSRTPV